MSNKCSQDLQDMHQWTNHGNAGTNKLLSKKHFETQTKGTYLEQIACQEDKCDSRE